MKRFLKASLIAAQLMVLAIACTNDKVIGPALAGIDSALQLLSKKEGNQLQVDENDRLYVAAPTADIIISKDSANALRPGSDGLLFVPEGKGKGPPWSGGGLEFFVEEAPFTQIDTNEFFAQVDIYGADARELLYHCAITDGPTDPFSKTIPCRVEQSEPPPGFPAVVVAFHDGTPLGGASGHLRVTAVFPPVQ